MTPSVSGDKGLSECFGDGDCAHKFRRNDLAQSVVALQFVIAEYAYRHDAATEPVADHQGPTDIQALFSRLLPTRPDIRSQDLLHAELARGKACPRGAMSRRDAC